MTCPCQRAIPREAFIAAMGSLGTRRLVFIDESGFKTSLARSCGWAPRSDKPLIYTPKYGTHLTIIGARRARR